MSFYSACYSVIPRVSLTYPEHFPKTMNINRSHLFKRPHGISLWESTVTEADNPLLSVFTFPASLQLCSEHLVRPQITLHISQLAPGVKYRGGSRTKGVNVC